MRTKTLLTAAAALAATVISSEAQTVFSANVVGYANVVIPGGFSLVCNPFDDGNGNQLTNVLGTLVNSLPAKSSVTTWNTGLQSFNGPITGGVGTWNANTTLTPGVGFFLKNGTVASPSLTNTFVGTIVALNQTSVTNGLAANFTLVGSQVPYAGDVMSDTNLNLVNAGLAGKSSVTTWNIGLQSYNGPVTFASEPGVPIPVTVGQGYFIKSVQGPTNWVQTLNLQ